MRIATVLVGLLFLGLSGWLGRASDTRRDTPRTPPGPASLLGGFSALAVQVLTMRASDAIARNDPAGALLRYDLVMELEPEMTGAADWIADEIGAGMAGDEPDPEAAWGLVLEGRRVHDRSVAANPGDVKPLILRAQYTLVRIARYPERDERYRAENGHTAFEAARRDLSTALDLDPTSVWALDLLGIAALQSGVRALLRGDAAATERLLEAEAALWAAIDIYREGGLDTAGKERALEACEALLEIAAAPAEERATRYAAAYATYGGADGIPALPAPEGR